MKLSDYNVRCIAGPIRSGRSTATLSFDCPRCGPPHRISVLVSDFMDESLGVWKMDVPEGDYERISITPSINNHYHAKMMPCGWHGSIANGNIEGK